MQAATCAKPGVALAPATVHAGAKALRRTLLDEAMAMTETKASELAARLNVSPARVSEWRTGIAPVGIELVERIARVAPTLGKALARLHADRALAIIASAGNTPHADLARHMRQIGAELGDCNRAFDEATAGDGHVSDAERLTLAREALQLCEKAEAFRRAVTR